MSEIIEEPELTRIIQEMDSRGLDPVMLLDTSGHQVSWRPDPEMVPPMSQASNDSWREITPRDEAILELDSDDYDCIQIILSKITPGNGGFERHTLKTAHLSLEAVKKHLKGNNHETNNPVPGV